MTLCSYLNSAGRLSEERSFDLLGKLVSAESAIYHSGWTHCDLKPTDVMVLPENKVEIIDFGFC